MGMSNTVFHPLSVHSLYPAFLKQNEKQQTLKKKAAKPKKKKKLRNCLEIKNPPKEK